MRWRKRQHRLTAELKRYRRNERADPMSVTLWSRFEAIARARGAAPAVIHGETIVSFETLLEDALQWSGLAAEGVAPGDSRL